jgi:hypothetical protein
MVDFVRILKQYVESQNIKYEYGRKANLNLLKSNLDNEQIYCLHEPSPRKSKMNATNTRVQSYVFTGMFFLVKQSTMDMPYFTEMANDEARSKYVLNIEPMLEVYQSMVNNFACQDIEILQFDCIDVVNVLDTNKDGLLVTYGVEIDA